MNDLFFWKSWLPAERRAVSVVMAVMFCALGLVIFQVFSGLLSHTVRWDVLSQLSEIDISVDSLRFEDWKYEISIPSTLIQARFAPSAMTPDTFIIHLVMLIGLFGLSVTLAALTTLPRFWYFTGLMLFTLLLSLSRTELLGVAPGWEKTLMAATFLLYAGVGYYFHAFRPETGTVARIIVFIAITALLYLSVALTGSGEFRAFTFLAYSMPLWLSASILFLLFCATEIFYGLVWLTTSRTTGMGKKAFPNFLIAAILYLLVLLFAYIGNTGVADWGLVIVNPLLPGVIAALIGVYSLKRRSHADGNMIPYRETGFWIYTGLLIMTIAFVSFAMTLSNDPLVEVVEDIIINGQLGMGAAFLFYILANFLPIFRQGLEVHKVLYKPLNFSLLKARGIGIGLVVALFSMQSLFPIHQGIAAYFNGLGDLYNLTGERVLAEQYYKMSLQQEFQNHKANYALASLSLAQGDENAAIFYFRQASLKKPSPHAYIGLSNLLLKENMYFEALFSLREGLVKFPGNGEILNNLGLLYMQTHVADSAYLYLNAATGVIKDPSVPATNLLAVIATTLQGASLDSSLQTLKPYKALYWQANNLVLQNLTGRSVPQPADPEATPGDSLLSASAYAYWVNYGFNQARNDTTLSQTLQRLAEKNPLAGDELPLAALYAEFYGGDKTRALEQLLGLAENSGRNAPLYRKILGHWFLQLGLYAQAITQFSAVSNEESLIGQAIAQALHGQPETGAILLERLRTGASSSLISDMQQKLQNLRPVNTAERSLLNAALKEGTEAAYLRALGADPFRAETVNAVAGFFRDQKKQPEKAFQVIVNAVRFNEASPELWESYALLCLDLGLMQQAEDALEKVRELASPTGYTTFSTRYQSQKALIEKAREEFNQNLNL